MAYVWLNTVTDDLKAMEILYRAEGIEAVYGKDEAVSLFHLHPDRIGDLMATGYRGTVFGPLKGAEEALPKDFRAHRSRHEIPVPLVIYNAKVNLLKGDEYVCNYHLTSHIFF